MTFARVTSLGLSACLAVACATYDSSLLVDAPADGASGAGGGTSGTGGAAAGSAGKSAGGGGSTMGGAGGSSSGAGGAGAGAAGASGGGAGGASSGSGGAGTAGTAGASGAGTAGIGGAGQAGSAGGGAAGTSGAGGAGVGGTAGEAGTGGAAGSAGTSGAGGAGAGGAGAGGAGAGGAGTGGVSGSGGAGTGGSAGKACAGPADCDDANACTTDTCNSIMQCEHAALVDDTATPGVTPDPADCKASVCKAGKVALVPAPAESGDDGNLCTTDSCSMAGTPQHTPLTGVIACDVADATKVCVSGVCKANACGDGVLAGAEQCDGSNLNGQSCAGLGYTGGTLSCLPGSCTFATIGCLAAGDLVITEVMYDTLIAVQEPEGEWIEIYNPTAKPVDLRGLTITRGSGSHTITGASAITVQPSSYFVVGASMAGSGGATLGYAYGTGIQLSNSGSNTITLTVGGLTIDSLPYTASGTYSGKSYSLKSGLLTAAANDVGANFCAGKTSYGAGGLGTPGAPNDCP